MIMMRPQSMLSLLIICTALLVVSTSSFFSPSSFIVSPSDVATNNNNKSSPFVVFRSSTTQQRLKGPNNHAHDGSDLGQATIDTDITVDRIHLPRRLFWNRSLSIVAAGSGILSAISPSATSNAVETTKTNELLEPYDDGDYGFHVSIPSSWEKSEQKLSGRRKAFFFTDPTSKNDTEEKKTGTTSKTSTIETFGLIAYTPVRDDFTSLASFGSVDNVAQMTILPKGSLAGPESEVGNSKLLSAVSKNNAYYFDYVATPMVPVEAGTTSSSSSSGALTRALRTTHFRTIFTLLPLKDSAGMTLVTITLQTPEENYGTIQGLFDQIINSYGRKSQ